MQKPFYMNYDADKRASYLGAEPWSHPEGIGRCALVRDGLHLNGAGMLSLPQSGSSKS